MINNKKNPQQKNKGVICKMNKKQKICLYIFCALILLVFVLVLSNILSKTDIKIQNEKLSKEMFLSVRDKIELRVANLLLDGTVTDDKSLGERVNYIDEMLANREWDKLEIQNIEEFDGIWSLDKLGVIKFKFNSIAPEWINDDDVKDYIISK